MSGLIPAGMDWLYFALMGMLSILFGTFGSVFNTYAGLYKAKDNDLLISMPIPPSKILLSRMAGVLGLSLLYSALMWVPSMIFYWIAGTPTVLAVVFEILLIPVIALLVSTLTCVLGWLVALISSRLKNRSFVVLLLSLFFFGLYYFVCLRLSNIMTSLIDHMDEVGNAVRNWFNFLYQLGLAATGKVVPLLIFTAIAAALFAFCYYVLSKTFIRIATNKDSADKAVYVEKAVKQRGVQKTLFMRELKHFTSNATYMLNCGLGAAFMIVLAILILINRGKILPVLDSLMVEPSMIYEILPVILSATIGLLAGLNMISTPSVSLEGKTLWLIRSLPVKTESILFAKLNLHFIINEVPILFFAVVAGIALNLPATGILLTIAIATLFNLLIGAAGLALGTKRANLIWTSQMQPIKSSSNILIIMLFGWIVSAAIGGLYFLVWNYMSATVYCILWIVLLAALNALLILWLKKGGVRTFNQLPA